MTEKIARRGIDVPAEYISDLLAFLKVSKAISPKLSLLAADETIQSVRQRLASAQPGWTHQGYPVVDANENLLGVLTLRDIHNPAHIPTQPIGDLISRPPITIYSDATLRDVANEMIRHDVGRVVVVDPAKPRKPIGLITRSDLLRAQRSILDETTRVKPDAPWRWTPRPRPT